jgi:hypothetical protein
MATEDLTTWTEYDPNGLITVAAGAITATSLTCDSPCYVRKDGGAGHFGDFSHELTLSITPVDGWPHHGIYWCGAATPVVEGYDSADIVLVASDYYVAGDTLYLYTNGNTDRCSTLTLFVTTYYLTVSRAGTTTSCAIYSDSGRTTLVDTISVTGGVGAQRYVALAYGNGTAGHNTRGTVVISNVDLKEASGAGVVPLGWNSGMSGGMKALSGGMS